MRLENKSILDYSNKITELNAQERLYIITKKCKLPKDRSTPWNFLPNLEIILQKEKENIKIKLEKVKIIEKNNQIFNSYESIYNEKYQPEFVKDMDEQKIKQFGELLNNKIRKVKLAISKIKLDSNRYKNYEIEKKRADNINYKNEMKLIYGKKIKNRKYYSPKLNQYNKEREIIYGIKRKRFKSSNERFDKYQEEFNRNIVDLENTIGHKLNKNINLRKTKNNFKHDISQNNERFNSFNCINTINIKKIKKYLLPSINKTPVLRKNISPIKKIN